MKKYPLCRYLLMNMEYNGCKTPTKIDLSERRKQKLIRELISTEKSFLNHLDLILECYVKPLKESNIIDNRKIDCIFNSIYTIKLINTALFNSLIECSDADVISAFLQFAPYLKVYSIYASNFNNAQNLLIHEREKNKQFDTFIRNQEMSNRANGLTLESLLITPIQRIPRYRLLLEQLLTFTKQTPHNETYTKNLINAISLVEQAANHLNEAIREHENFRKLLDIQKKFCTKTTPNILNVPFRRFIKEGKLLKVSSKGKSLERYVHLFSDIVMYSKYTTTKIAPIYQNVKDTNTVERLKCCCIMPIQHCNAEIIFGRISSSTGALFQIKCKQDKFLFYSTSSIEVENWIREINKAKECYKKNVNTLKKESSRKKTMHRTSLIRHAKIMREQQKVLRQKVLNKSNLNETITFNEPINCANIFKKSKRKVKRCSSTTHGTLWQFKRRKKKISIKIGKKTENTFLNYPSSVSTTLTIESNRTEMTSYPCIASTITMETVEFKKCLPAERKGLSDICAIQ